MNNEFSKWCESCQCFVLNTRTKCPICLRDLAIPDRYHAAVIRLVAAIKGLFIPARTGGQR